MAINTDQFVTYAAYRIPPSKIAAALGITPGRVTQLLENEKVQALVQAKKAEIATEELDDRRTLDSARHRLLERINDLVDETDSLAEATMALERLTKIKDSGRIQEPGQGHRGPNLVTLELPSFLSAKLSIELSNQNEIIEVNGRSMATLPTLATHQMIKDHQQAHEGLDYDHHAKQDPPTGGGDAKD